MGKDILTMSLEELEMEVGLSTTATVRKDAIKDIIREKYKGQRK